MDVGICGWSSRAGDSRRALVAHLDPNEGGKRRRSDEGVREGGGKRGGRGLNW
jgi:hypothetical protein